MASIPKLPMAFTTFPISIALDTPKSNLCKRWLMVRFHIFDLEQSCLVECGRGLGGSSEIPTCVMRRRSIKGIGKSCPLVVFSFVQKAHILNRNFDPNEPHAVYISISTPTDFPLHFFWDRKHSHNNGKQLKSSCCTRVGHTPYKSSIALNEAMCSEREIRALCCVNQGATSMCLARSNNSRIVWRSRWSPSFTRVIYFPSHTC